jgi:type VI secretion system secreted protein VgrG
MPPYLGDGPDSKHKNDNKLTGVKSNTTLGGEGFNEWRFDDSKGKEQLFLHAERNMDVRVKNDSMESVGANEHLTVGGEKDGKKWGESREHIFKDKHVSVDNMLEAKAGDAKILVGGGDGSGNLDLYVEGEWLTTVDKAASMHFKDERWTVVDKDDMLKVKGGVQTQVDKEFMVDATDGVQVFSSKKIVLQSQGEICLSALGGFIKIDRSGVTIVGTLVKINSGGSPTGATALGLSETNDAEKAEPKKPTPADDAKTGYKSSP